MNEQDYFAQFSGESEPFFQMRTYPVNIGNVRDAWDAALRRAMQYPRWKISVGMHDEYGNWQEKYHVTSDDYFSGRLSYNKDSALE